MSQDKSPRELKLKPRFNGDLFDGYDVVSGSTTMDGPGEIYPVIERAAYDRLAGHLEKFRKHNVELAAELAEARQKALLAQVGGGHYRNELNVHIKEGETFVKEATAKIAELTEKLAAAEKERDAYKAAARPHVNERCIELGQQLQAERERADKMTDIAHRERLLRDQARAECERLKKEVEALRLFGNKDCTAMADDYLERGESY